MVRACIVVAVFFMSFAPAAAVAAGDREKGRDIARRHCARCHVIGDQDRMGGIGSTPSFPLLRRMGDWRERFGTFYNRLILFTVYNSNFAFGSFMVTCNYPNCISRFYS